MKSIKLQLRDAIEAIEREKLTANDVIGCDAYQYTSLRIQVTDEAIVRLYHQLRIPRSALKAEAEDGYLHVRFSSRGVVFCACVRLEKAATFIDSKQQSLPAPKSKRIGKSAHQRLAYVGDVDH